MQILPPETNPAVRHVAAAASATGLARTDAAAFMVGGYYHQSIFILSCEIESCFNRLIKCQGIRDDLAQISLVPGMVDPSPLHHEEEAFWIV